MTIQAAINQFCDYLIVERGYSSQTLKAYKHDLLGFDGYLIKTGRMSTIEGVTQADIVSYLAYLTHQDGLKKPNIATTRARKLASIRSFFTFLRKRKFLVINPADDIDTPSIPTKESDYLTVVEYKQLLAAIDQTATPFFKLRDTLIISLFLSSGLRVSELAGLHVGDIDLENQTIKVHRKRDKYQTIPLTHEVALLFAQYLNQRQDFGDDLVFISKKHQGMRSNSVYCLVRKYLKIAKIKKSTFGCHLLRHSCFSALLANNVNLVVIQELAGHANLNTTRRYLHLNNTQIREAVETIHLGKGFK